jgi:hypothetical protein
MEVRMGNPRQCRSSSAQSAVQQLLVGPTAHPKAVSRLTPRAGGRDGSRYGHRPNTPDFVLSRVSAAAVSDRAGFCVRATASGIREQRDEHGSQERHRQAPADDSQRWADNGNAKQALKGNSTTIALSEAKARPRARLCHRFDPCARRAWRAARLDRSKTSGAEWPSQLR